jgi:hypothetical protein
MTKKDYVRIAKVIHDVTDDTSNPHALGACARLTQALADALFDDNPSFDRARFLDACTPKG